MSSGGNTIADIYRSVISDVINQVKESFLDENVDLDVLTQLKKEWEDKVNSSGCVDLDASANIPQRPSNIVPPPVRPSPQINRMPVQGQPMRIQPQMMHQNQIQDQSIRMQYTQQPAHQNVGMSVGGQSMHQQLGQIRMFPGGGGPQFVLPNGQQLQPGQLVLMQQPDGHQIPMSVGPNGVLQQRVIQQQQPQQLSHMNQMDGNGGFEEASSSSGVANSSRRKKCTKKSKKEAVRVLGSILKSMQMDGGGGGMSDSSSEDEPEEEDDPLRRIADRIGDGEVEDAEQTADDEPLNSDDDQSDDEDDSILFDSDNVVMCQFEKVNRARTKWKFQLKDGIMHIDKKDYCFQKCSGEAEW